MAGRWTIDIGDNPRVTPAVVGAISVAQLEDTLRALGNDQFSPDRLVEIDRYATASGFNLWVASGTA